MAETLRVEDMHVRFGVGEGQVKALNGINLTMEDGEIYCIVGESGAGKSTLALAIMGLLPTAGSITQGSVMFEGTDLVQAGPDHMRKLRGNAISMVFQDAQAALNPVQMVGPQLEEVMLTHIDVSP